jgi:hypothetical protein
MEKNWKLVALCITLGLISIAGKLRNKNYYRYQWHNCEDINKHVDNQNRYYSTKLHVN